MATEDQGIMSLPQGGQPAAQNLTLEDSHDAVMQGLQNASPEASAALQQTMQGLTAQLDQLSDEELDIVLQAIQYLYQGGEKEYAKRLQEILSSGLLDAGDLPEEFDPEILSAIGTVLLQAKQQRQMGNQREQAMQPPAQFARGGIADAARLVASKGRAGDTMLAHINKDEARLLRKHGGSATINPSTGLVEYSWLSKGLRSIGRAVSGVVKGVVNTVKSIVKSPIGKILGTVALATFLGPGAFGISGLGMSGAAAMGLASGATTLLAGGNLKQALISGATAFFGAPGGAVSNLVGQAGITGLAANAALSAGIVGTGAGLLSGQKLADAVKSGLTAGAIGGLTTGIQHGFTSGPNLPQAPIPGQEGYSEALANTPAREPMTPQQVQSQIAQGPAATRQAIPSGAQGSTDALGDFITSRGIGAAPQPGALAKVPTIGESLGRIGGGISDLVQGQEGAMGRITGGLGDLFSPSAPKPTDILQSADFKALTTGPNAISTDKALDILTKSSTPGMLRSYGPMIGAGLAAAGAMGGFKPTQPAPSALASELRARDAKWGNITDNPEQFYPQNLPGVKYDERGAIIGSTPWEPKTTMADVRVPAQQSGIGSLPALGSSPMYTPDFGTMGQSRQIAQPYNTPSMYSNLMPPMGYPRYAAEGGMIEEPVQHLAFGGVLNSMFDAVRRILQTPEQRAQAEAAAQQQAAAAQEAAAAQQRAAAAQQQAAERAAQAVRDRRQAMAAQFAQGLQFNPRAAAQQARSAQPYNTSAPYGNLVSPPGMPPSDEIRIPEYGMPWATQPVTPPSNELRGGANVPAPARFSAFQASPAQLRAQAYFNPAQAGLMAAGGLASLAQGGYPRRTGQISGPGTETSDSIPAMLSDGEFVMTAKAVRGAGNGSRRAGAKKMYALMHQLERNASRG